MSNQFSIVRLKHGRQLIASYSLAKNRSQDWIVYLTESGSPFRMSGRSELKELIGARAAAEFNFLTVNKPGLNPGRTNRKEFEQSFRRGRRVEDARAALTAVIPRGHRIHLIGYSEGAYLAPQVARLDKRVQSIAMIGGGTRGWLKEELANASAQERAQYRRKIAEIYRHPQSGEKWNGFSYATWYSYRGDNTLHALRELRVPVLAILGARDHVIDLKTTILDLMLISERKPTEVHVFGDCGHYFSKHWDHVARVLSRFLLERRAPTGS